MTRRSGHFLRLLFCFALSVCAVAAALYFFRHSSSPDRTVPVKVRGGSGGSIIIHAEVARTPDEWQRGLMERTDLPENGGMLFIFPEARPLSFWMKNTRIGLDILFFDEKGTNVGTASMTPCIADPCALYSADKPAKFALEVSGGFLQKHNEITDWHLERIAGGGL